MSAWKNCGGIFCKYFLIVCVSLSLLVAIGNTLIYDSSNLIDINNVVNSWGFVSLLILSAFLALAFTILYCFKSTYDESKKWILDNCEVVFANQLNIRDDVFFPTPLEDMGSWYVSDKSLMPNGILEIVLYRYIYVGKRHYKIGKNNATTTFYRRKTQS